MLRKTILIKIKIEKAVLRFKNNYQHLSFIFLKYNTITFSFILKIQEISTSNHYYLISNYFYVNINPGTLTFILISTKKLCLSHSQYLKIVHSNISKSNGNNERIVSEFQNWYVRSLCFDNSLHYSNSTFIYLEDKLSSGFGCLLSPQVKTRALIVFFKVVD